MRKTSRKHFVSTIAIALLSLTFANEALAYKAYGGRFTQDPYYTKYYNDATTYSNFSFMNHRLSFEDAMYDWNNTQNTKIWFVKTTNKSESILDLTHQYSSDPKLYGYTELYNGNTPVTDPYNNYWYWARAWTNPAADWNHFPSGASYKNKSLKLRWTSAHEIGHALGLDHTAAFPNLSYRNTLMYQSPDPYYLYGIYRPTLDEVAGVQKIYGYLY